MRRRSKVWMGGLFAAGVAFSTLHAQLSSPGQRSFSHATPPAHRELLEDWPKVGFDVTALDSHDAPVTSLTASQLEVRENGKAVPSFDLLPSNGAPQSICIVVDASGSTFTDRDVIRKSVLKLISDLPPRDEVCLVDFSAEANVDSDLTMDRNQLRLAVDYIKISGGSAVNDAVEQTTTYLLKNAQFRSRAIVLLSDGSDNASTNPPGDLIKALHTPGAPVVYALSAQAAGRHEASEKPDHRALEKLADESGGFAWFAKGDAEVDAKVANLVQTLDRRYRLILTTAGTQDGSTRRLDVTLVKDLRKQKMILNAPRSYDAVLQ